MKRTGELARIEAEYGYPCRHQNEFAVCSSPLQFNNIFLSVLSLQALLVGLRVVH